MWKLFVCVVLCAFALEDCQAQLKLNNPCPERFTYETTNEKGRWVGTLNLVSDHKLYGTWIRLIFDAPIKGVEVANDQFEVKPLLPDESGTEILIKNRDFVLNKGKSTPLKITVLYKGGGKAPSLKAYRLNARYLCPETDEYEKLYA